MAKDKTDLIDELYKKAHQAQSVVRMAAANDQHMNVNHDVTTGCLELLDDQLSDMKELVNELVK